MPLSVVSAGTPIPGNADVALLARVRAQRYAPLLTQGTVAGIAWTLTDLSPVAAPATPQIVATGVGIVAACVFDQLVLTDPSWTRDGPNIAAPETGYQIPGQVLGVENSYGYNFRLVIPAAAVAVAASGDRFQCDVAITMVSGEVVRMVFRWQSQKVYG